MSAKIITVAQQKGGAGKTTMAAHLAVAFTKAGRSVAAIDIDRMVLLSRTGLMGAGTINIYDRDRIAKLNRKNIVGSIRCFVDCNQTKRVVTANLFCGITGTDQLVLHTNRCLQRRRYQ